MASGTLSPVAKQYFWHTVTGEPLAGGLVYTVAAGGVYPGNAITTFQDDALTVANANPIHLNGAGYCTIYLTPGQSYKYIVTDGSGVLDPRVVSGVIQWTQDGVRAIDGEVSLGYINVKDAPYNAAGDGLADDTIAIRAAYAALPATGGLLYFPPGTYKITSQLDFSDARNVVIRGAGMGATKLLVSGGVMGSSPFYGAIKLSTTTAGWKTLRDFTLGRASVPTSVLANDNGLVLGPVQNVVNLERVAVENMRNDALLHRGNSANVNILGCSFRENRFGYAVNGSGASDAVQNLVARGNSFYNNAGGVLIANSYGVTIDDNDIEGDIDALYPMLSLTGSNIYLSGNTLGFPATATTATKLAVLNGENIVSIGGVFAIGATGRTGIEIGAAARRVILSGPQVSAGIGVGGTGISVIAGAQDTLIVNPNYGNTFTTNLVDAGTRTALWSGPNLTAEALDVTGIVSATVAAGTGVYVKRAAGGDMLRVNPAAAGSGASVDVVNSTEADYQPWTIYAKTLDFQTRTGVGTTASIANADSTGLNAKKRLRGAKGATVAAANDLTLGGDGNLFHISGATQINAITTLDWQAGSEFTLIFDSNPTIKHNTSGGAGTAKILTKTAADIVAAANYVFKASYDGTSWFQSN